MENKIHNSQLSMSMNKLDEIMEPSFSPFFKKKKNEHHPIFSHFVSMSDTYMCVMCSLPSKTSFNCSSNRLLLQVTTFTTKR